MSVCAATEDYKDVAAKFAEARLAIHTIPVNFEKEYWDLCL
ncbi:MAG: hypothetical protein ACLRMI_00445 [Streptococcus sp.]